MTEDAKGKYFASLYLGAMAAKHVSQVLTGGPGIIFLAMKNVQLVFRSPPTISLFKLHGVHHLTTVLEHL